MRNAWKDACVLNQETGLRELTGKALAHRRIRPSNKTGCTSHMARSPHPFIKRCPYIAVVCGPSFVRLPKEVFCSCYPLENIEENQSDASCRPKKLFVYVAMFQPFLHPLHLSILRPVMTDDLYPTTPYLSLTSVNFRTLVSYAQL